MKVIDLLNKIANGEKVPKWVVYDKKEYTYREEYKDYVHTVYNNGTMLFLLSEIFDKNGIDIFLNQELDFIEEDKKIEKVNIYVLCDYDFKNKDEDNNLIATNIIDKAFEEYSHKINEIIDKINEEK